MTVFRPRLPPNPYVVRLWKKMAAAADARRGRPAGPVHPAQGPPCDRTYARQYMAVRASVMTEEERMALFMAEQDFKAALEDVEEALRRAEQARARIVRLVAPGA